MSVRARPPGRALVALALLVGAALLAAVVPATPAGAAPGPPPPRYRPPVDAPVSDPFREPAGPYGAGNRGLEYDTPAGTEVRAAAAGQVTFAGRVAGTQHVTVLHADGLRTSASGLATVAVVVGQRVEAGQVVGTTAGRLHFGARSGDAYLDPAALFEPGPVRVRLVPFDHPPGEGPAGERSALRQLLDLGRGVVGGLREVGERADAVVGLVAEHGGELARLALEYGPSFVPHLDAILDLGVAVEAALVALEQALRPCTRSDEPVEPPSERRIALLVAGLGSSSEEGAVDDVDTGALGYDREDVLRFSYAGGRTPRSAGPPGPERRDYDAADTQQDLRESGRRLADLVQDVARAAPGVPIDLVAHSQGGLVARLAVAELERRGDHDAVALLATIATPHGGSDAATAARLVALSPVGERLLRAGGEALAGIDPTSLAVQQLSETSDVVAELAGTDLPDGLAAVSIAARSDLLVPVPRTQLEGAPQAVVPLMSPTAHDALPGHAGTTRELLLALDGRPPTCKGVVEAVADQAVGAGISWGQDQVAPFVAAATDLGPLGLVP